MRKLELILWFRCNCRCRFCVVDPIAARQALQTPDAVRLLERGRREGAVEVDFGGGEPTLRQDLPELARRAKILGYERVGVKSNGLRLCYPEVVAELREAGVDRFALPVWGPTPAAHDALALTEGAFEMMEMALKHVLDLGAEAQVDVLLTTETVPRLTELTRSLAALGARLFEFRLFCLFGSGGALPELLPTLEDAGRAVVAAARAAPEARCSTPHVPACFLPGAPGLYTDIREARLVIAAPGGTFPVEASPFEAGVKARRCAGCAEDARCGGMRPEYLERHPETGLRPR